MEMQEKLPETVGGEGVDVSVDLSRRFAAIDRLYGPGAADKAEQAHVVVAGIGGVGSWTVEALARSGVGNLTLIDLDHVSESNINRQLHALTTTIGASKIEAMAQRLQGVNPNCNFRLIDDFVAPENVAEIIPADADFVIDATDQLRAKVALILDAKSKGLPLVVCGAAGGKTDSLALQKTDLAHSQNDALLASIRQNLRRHHGYPRASNRKGQHQADNPKMGVTTLWFQQEALRPNNNDTESPLQGLSCAGYGSLVTVTATMGMAAAGVALTHVLMAA